MVEQMEQASGKVYFEVKPIVHTYVFELKKNWKKFLGFLIVSILIVLLLSWLPYFLVPQQLEQFDTQVDYLKSGLSFINFIIIFAACFFFGGIICSEFEKKTGYIIFPKINKYKLIIGKYLSALTLMVVILGTYYLSLGILAVLFYGEPIISEFIYSFIVALIYVFAVSGFVTFFSSIMKKSSMAIVSSIMILLMVFNILDSLIIMLNPNIEPLYSLSYMSNLIIEVMAFPDPRYQDMIIPMRDLTIRRWLTPELIVGISVMFIYMVSSFIAAAYVFKRRQL